MNKSFITLMILLVLTIDIVAQNDYQEYEKISTLLSSEKTTTQKVYRAAKYLIGRPYVAGTLDSTNQEKLTVSLSKFDCVTFMETCLALALDSKSGNSNYDNFKHQVENIRYRNGKNAGYCSRLHYSTDWISDNTSRGNIVNKTSELGGILLNKYINFMSTHAILYRYLKENPLAVDTIRSFEKRINQNHTLYIPKQNLAKVSEKIKTGSLLFLTTSMAGLDFAHVGVAVNENGVLKMIHASSIEKKIVMTSTPLSDYLASIHRFTGIAVLEPN